MQNNHANPMTIMARKGPRFSVSNRRMKDNKINRHPAQIPRWFFEANRRGTPTDNSISKVPVGIGLSVKILIVAGSLTLLKI